jgi:hypothetical protein
MNMEKFTTEEINLMCVYDTGTRTGLLTELTAMQTHLEPDETELLELTRSVTEKLSTMSDEADAGLSETLVPDYGE